MSDDPVTRLHAASYQRICRRGERYADQAGLPVTGAFVLQKGTSNGTVTDLDGQFSINVPSNAVLEVSCMGYETQEVPVAGRALLNVVLAEDSQLLEEVIVVGYGTTKK